MQGTACTAPAWHGSAKRLARCAVRADGVDLRELSEEALAFYFSQPVVGPVAPHTLTAVAVEVPFDFTSISLDAIQRFDVPLSFTMNGISQLHGIALWFDCNFPGSQRRILLSTSPTEPLTHWYQVRCLL